VNVLWQASVSTPCAWPDVRFEVLDPVPQVGDTVTCFLVLREPAAADRSFTISASVPDLVNIGNPTIVLEETFSAREFQIDAVDLGRFRLVAKEGGVEVATSVQCGVQSPQSVVWNTTSQPGGSSDNPWGEPIEPSMFGRCRPPACGTQQNSLYHCGACTTGTPQVDCPNTAVNVIPGDCVWDLFSVCQESPDSALLTCPLFQLAGIETVTCGDVSAGGGISIKTRRINGDVNVGGSLTLRQRCCDYRRVEGQSGSVYVRDCI
jgi:hypothetical protein